MSHRAEAESIEAKYGGTLEVKLKARDFAIVVDKLDEYAALLRDAEHALVTLHGLHATDRPDLVDLPADLCWRVDESALLERIRAALPPGQAQARAAHGGDADARP